LFKKISLQLPQLPLHQKVDLMNQAEQCIGGDFWDGLVMPPVQNSVQSLPTWSRSSPVDILTPVLLFG